MVSQWRLAEPAGEAFWGEANATVKKKYGDRTTQRTCAFGGRALATFCRQPHFPTNLPPGFCAAQALARAPPAPAHARAQGQPEGQRPSAP